MPKNAPTASAAHPDAITLRDPVIAAILGWLIPGLGHLYQGRTFKGVLFMVTILGTFFYGLYLSNGRAVYASWLEEDKRYPYLCQIGVGLPALPALLQTYRVRHGEQPLFGGLMAPPVDPAQLNEWYKSMNRYFDLGTVYTMIAGLLNILAIYDAWGGPVFFEISDDKKRVTEQVAPSGG